VVFLDRDDRSPPSFLGRFHVNLASEEGVPTYALMMPSLLPGETSKHAAPVCQIKSARASSRRVLMARAQRLAEKVGTMSAKIQELEAALARYTGEGDIDQSFSTPASGSLPLGDVDMTWDPALSRGSDAFRSGSVDSGSDARYHGKLPGSEVNHSQFAGGAKLNFVTPQYLEDPLAVG
jgi:hypothetical protein